MRVYKNLTIIGTSHISKESILKVGNFISKNKPDIIALELDRKRLIALIDKRKPGLKDIGEIGIKGFLINLIGAYIEKKLGKLVGVMPGSEMKTAFELSREYNTKIALIDQDISITLKKLGRRITFKEKFRIVKDLLKGIIFRKSDIEPFDLTKVPSESLILKLISKVKERYPNIYDVLIEERNIIMAKGLYKIMNENKDKKILAIIGAGHEKGIFEILKGN
ncbi:MAG: TraB family protein [archaeon GW2011_AR20]|nr:MAG: TraB family protein [archaeon GW2011_AR20]MBS3160602.1 TraB/GumN family protein [Candidatus Woesearchaeota archaeon]